jgi:hypothetical protein
MTLSAGQHDMQSEQRESGHIVIEIYVPPLRGGVTLFARRERRRVGIVAAMAPETVHREFRLSGDACVAGMAVEPGMRVLQLETELRVIEVFHAPALVPMTIATCRPKAHGMTVIGRMTTRAVLRNGSVHITAFMTLRAANLRVTAEECEACLARVVELL